MCFLKILQRIIRKFQKMFIDHQSNYIFIEAKYVYRGPSCYGSCSVADPVLTSIGNFYHETNDFTLNDFDELALTRVYNSYHEDNASIFGTNFSSNFEQYIAYDKDDNMLFFRGDGKILKINKVDGKYSPKKL